jgi:glycosyltransferase involved in cell wall biosynthesis
MVSVLILTLNESTNIQACLDSVSWCDDIIVLDSASTDNTCMIAKGLKAQVIIRPFDNWSTHQNWAIENIRFKHDWVLYIDADERVTSELRSEIESILKIKPKEVAFFLGRKNIFYGKWIKHAFPPSMIMRLFRPSKVRFDRLVNPVPIISGPHGYLKNNLIHFNFSKGLEEWFSKHNQYSTLEATEGLKLLKQPLKLSLLFSRDRYWRRMALKSLFFRVPFRPAIKFLIMYFLKFGFLDGKDGLEYCIMQTMYEQMIVLKMREQRAQAHFDKGR